jgi:hypothetical protein
VSFVADSLVVTVKKSKTDPYRRGHTVHIAKRDPPACAVFCLQQLRNALGIPTKNSPIFCRIDHNGSPCIPITRIAYSRALEIFREQISRCELPSKLYGLHSLRSGGTTWAKEKNKANDLVRKHGRWATQSSFDRYVKDSIDSMLSVTRD